MPDSNPAFSGLWRSIIQWFGNSEQGWLPNPFSPDSPGVTLRSYLEVLNFKANHRKVLITDQEAIVTSANTHDASAYHSNIAFVLKGKIIEDLLETEKAVANFSGGNIDLFKALPVKTTDWEQSNDLGYKVQVLTEGKIKEHLLKDIRETKAMDTINIGVFYLSDRDIIKGLLEASERNVEISIILDANKDAFGREKIGIPNRPVAHELRNLDDFNFETNIKVIGTSDLEIMQEAKDYFKKLWLNEEGLYTLNYPEYADESIFKQLVYRFQEWSGISSF